MGNGITTITLLIALTASFAYINFRWIKLPSTIGIMFMALACSLLLVVVGQFHNPFLHLPVKFLSRVHFESVVMNILLSFLLFAGSIHVDVKKLKREIIPVASFATISVVLSTVIVGILLYAAFKLFGQQLDLIYCLLFGALISPTDPIAALGILKKAGIPSSLEAKITGESLFNDGIGVALFITLLDVATNGTSKFSIGDVTWLIIREAIGGIMWGFVIGYIGFWLLRSINQVPGRSINYTRYCNGGLLSGLSISCFGFAYNGGGRNYNWKQRKSRGFISTKQRLSRKIWELIDEILNAVLFLLIGFEVLVIPFSMSILYIGLIAIVIVLLARFISVLIPTFILSFRLSFEKNMIPILTWGALRGGISVALALLLPDNMHSYEIVPITYIVVIFSILTQGLTIGKLVRQSVKKRKNPPPPPFLLPPPPSSFSPFTLPPPPPSSSHPSLPPYPPFYNSQCSIFNIQNLNE